MKTAIITLVVLVVVGVIDHLASLKDDPIRFLILVVYATFLFDLIQRTEPTDDT